MLDFVFQRVAELCVFLVASLGFISLFRPGVPRFVNWKIRKCNAEMRKSYPCFYKWLVALVFVALASGYALYVKNKFARFENERWPALRCNIHYPYPVAMPDDTNRFGILFDVQVMNDGAASRIWKWKCRAKLTSGKELPVAEAPPDPDYLPSLPKFTKDNYLPSTLFKNAIGLNGESGWAWFPFNKSYEADLFKPGVEFEIEFEDSQGRKAKSIYIRPKL